MKPEGVQGFSQLDIDNDLACESRLRGINLKLQLVAKRNAGIAKPGDWCCIVVNPDRWNLNTLLSIATLDRKAQGDDRNAENMPARSRH